MSPTGSRMAVTTEETDLPTFISNPEIFCTRGKVKSHRRRPLGRACSPRSGPPVAPAASLNAAAARSPAAAPRLHTGLIHEIFGVI